MVLKLDWGRCLSLLPLLVANIIVLVLLLNIDPVNTNEAATGPVQEKSPDVTVRHLVIMRSDLTRVYGELSQQSFDITTKFGKLTVPIEHINSIRFGNRTTDKQVKEIKEQINKLGSLRFKDRIAAEAYLFRNYRIAGPFVKEHVDRTEITDPEVKKRLDDFIDKYDRVYHDRTWSDVIHTSVFDIKGEISPRRLTIQHKKLKKLDIDTEDIDDIIVLKFLQKTITLKPFEPGDVWIDTGLMVTKHHSIEVSAIGLINFDANVAESLYNNISPLGITDRLVRTNLAPAQNCSTGAVIVKAGSAGVFHIDEFHNLAKVVEGTVYVGIAIPQGWNLGNCKPSGEFKVTVRLIPHP